MSASWAQPPALKGLKPVEFAGDDDDQLVTVEFGDFADRSAARLFRGLREWIIEKFGADDADKALPPWDVDTVQEEAAQPDPGKVQPAFTEPANPKPSKEDSVDEKELAAQQAALKDREERVKAGEAAFAEKTKAQSEAERQIAKREAGLFLDGLTAEGRFPPGHRDTMASFMAGLDDAEDALEFGESEDGKPVELSQRGYVTAFLKSMPKQIDFSERTGEDGTGVDEADPEAVADQAVAYQEEMRAKGVTVSTDAAVRHVLKGASK